MDKHTISLIGIVDTLKYLLETDKKAKKSADATAACQRLEKMRVKLLSEGLRQSQVLGSARDTIFEVAMQLDSHLSTAGSTRNVQWVIHGLLSADIQEVEPPPLPSSSSNGPKSASPEIMQLAQMLSDAAAARAATVRPAISALAGVPQRVMRPKPQTNGKSAKG